MKVDAWISSKIQEANRKNLQYIFRYLHSCSFVLGSGISYGVGLPSWDGLLNRLIMQGAVLDVRRPEDEWVRDHPSMYRDVIASVLTDKDGGTLLGNVDPLEKAEYIVHHLESYDVYMRRAYGMLYDSGKHNFEEYLAHITRNLLRQASDEYADRKTSDPKTSDWKLLQALADVATKTNGVRQIITYNYDDALEQAIENHRNAVGKLDCEYKSLGMHDCVYQANAKKTHIYHVHGKLSVFMRNNEGCDDQRIVLSESSYRNIEREIYGYTNTCQAQMMLAHANVLMGFSARDPNYRRLLRGIPCHPCDESKIERCLQKRDYAVPDRMKRKHFILYSVNDLYKELCKKTEKLEVFATSQSQKDELTEARRIAMSELLNLQAAYLVRNSIFPVFIAHEDLLGIVEHMGHVKIRKKPQKLSKSAP